MFRICLLSRILVICIFVGIRANGFDENSYDFITNSNQKIKVRMIAFSLLCITWASAQNHDQEAMFFCANNCKVKTKEFKSLENLRLARSYIFRPKNVLLKKKLKFKIKPRFKRQYFQHYLRERVKKIPKQATVKTDFIRMTKIAVPIFTAG